MHPIFRSSTLARLHQHCPAGFTPHSIGWRRDTWVIHPTPNKKPQHRNDVGVKSNGGMVQALMMPLRMAYFTRSDRECRFSLCMIFSR